MDTAVRYVCRFVLFTFMFLFMKASPNENPMDRDYQLSLLEKQQEWDVLVIGGGASGLGVALEAATRGYATLLLEQADFAKGTSSRSTKLIHGGVRYLAQGDVRLVREASIERGLLYRNAPHLVKKLSFIIPVYGFFNRLRYTIGLKLYDAIAGKLRLGASVFISRDEVLDRVPNINPTRLQGGVLYHDGQFDDARLAINLAQTITEHNGSVINYMRVSSLVKNEGGRITGVHAMDQESGTPYVVKAKAVINATGVFVDQVLQMDEPGKPPRICVSQGIHLVLGKQFYPSPHALMIPETSDGRVLFAVPWYDKVILGTTDTPVAEASLEPRAMEKEIDFILDTAAGFLVQKPGRHDVFSVFAGLRPLAAPTGKKQKTREISRSHKILVSPAGLFTILGGKWTTFRKMGEDMINRIEQEQKWKIRPSSTKELHIHGYTDKESQDDPLSYYGSDAQLIREQIKNDNTCISDRLKITGAQVVWAVQKEMARTVEDFLSRRTRALLLDPEESIRMAPEVARIMGRELLKNDAWVEEQIANYTALANSYRV
jgi:glycerol-3-phosphate dehydrogenase